MLARLPYQMRIQRSHLLQVESNSHSSLLGVFGIIFLPVLQVLGRDNAAAVLRHAQ